MSDSLHSQPTNEVIYGGKQNTGINRTGLFFGNPISSYDINSTQNNLLNILAQYMTKTGESTASVDLEGWGASTVLDRNTKLHNIRASIYDAARGETYFIYCPNITLNPPTVKRDQYLKLYYKIIVYTQENRTNYENTEGVAILPCSSQVYRYGYRKSSSTASVEELAENDIGDNQIDSEVSVRLGIQWTLGWETAEDLASYSEGPIVALYRYKSASAEFLFNTTRQLAYNANILTVPTVYTKTIGNYIILDGIYDMLMTNSDTSVFKANVVFDQTFNIGANVHIVVGVKDAPDVSLEYRLVDDTVVRANSNWTPDLRWEANKPYLMHCVGSNLMYYTDPSFNQLYRVYAYKLSNNNGGSQDKVGSTYTTTANGSIITNSTTTYYIIYNYHISRQSWEPKWDVVYNIEGVDHYYHGEWRTVIPAGTIVSYPVYNNSSNSRAFPVGTVLCNGAKLNKTKYSKLQSVLGYSFGGSSSSNYFNLPDYGSNYVKSSTGNVTASNYKGGRSSFSLGANNIPSMQVKNTSGSNADKITMSFTTSNTTLSSSNLPSVTTTVKFKNQPTAKLESAALTDMMNIMLKHYHLPGQAAYHPGPGVLDSNAVMVNTGRGVITKSGTGVYQLDFDSSIKPSVAHVGIWRDGNATNGNTTVAAATRNTVNSKVYWSLTSLGISDTTISSTKYESVTLSGLNANDTSIFAVSNSIGTGKAHNHTGSVDISLSSLKVGTTGSVASVNLDPSYVQMNYYMYIGQPLIVPETSQQITINFTKGTVYTSPTVSQELYTATTD